MRILIVLFSSFILFTSCKEKYKYELNLNKNKTYRQKNIIDLTIGQEVNGKERTISTRNAFEILYKVISKKDSIMTLKTSIHSIYLKIDTPSEPIIFSTTSNDTSKVYNTIFKNMTNRDFILEVSKKGEVINAKNISNIFSNMFDKLPYLNPKEKEILKSQINQYYNENTFKNMQLFGNNFYPKESVLLKEKWVNKNKIKRENTILESNCEMTLKKHKKKYAIITFKGELTTIHDKNEITPISLNGTTEGAYKIDPLTGWLKEATIYQNLKGFTETPIKIGSSSVIKSPIKIDSKTTVIGY